MDDVDIANDRIAADLDRKIEAARNNVPHAIGAELCQHCDERIPLVRRNLGYSLCVPCAAQAERDRQMFPGARP